MRSLLPLFALLLLIAGSCKTTFDPALLQPTQATVEPRLPRLEIQDRGTEVSYASINNLTVNGKMFTLLDREMPNICEQRGEKKGTIEPVITILESNMTNKALFVFSTLTLYTINLLGAPMFTVDYQMEIVFNIRNTAGDKIWSKTYYREQRHTYGIYYGLGKRDDAIYLTMYRDMLSELKQDLQRDNRQIREELTRQTGV